MNEPKLLNVTLRIWRQPDADSPGELVDYPVRGVNPDMSFLEMLDVLNEGLIQQGKDPVAFDNDCREGICGMCGLVINGRAHGPDGGQTTCELRMRRFSDGDVITVEPFRARAFPVLADLMVDRSAFDRIIQAGGFNSVDTGQAPDANAVLVPKEDAEKAMDAAACIACGACVAACPNAAAMLFTSAKISHLGLLPQGNPERGPRARGMLAAHDAEGFGNCSNEYECEHVCPKEIKVSNIARLNREFFKASVLDE